jgi:hypothetical protein
MMLRTILKKLGMFVSYMSIAIMIMIMVLFLLFASTVEAIKYTITIGAACLIFLCCGSVLYLLARISEDISVIIEKMNNSVEIDRG